MVIRKYTFTYNFDTVLCQFLETGTSDRCLISIVQLLRFSGFRLYPLSFFLYSPFKGKSPPLLSVADVGRGSLQDRNLWPKGINISYLCRIFYSNTLISVRTWLKKVESCLKFIVEFGFGSVSQVLGVWVFLSEN